MDDGDPEFPRQAGYWWFGCQSEAKTKGRWGVSVSGFGYKMHVLQTTNPAWQTQLKHAICLFLWYFLF